MSARQTRSQADFSNKNIFEFVAQLDEPLDIEPPGPIVALQDVLLEANDFHSEIPDEIQEMALNEPNVPDLNNQSAQAHDLGVLNNAPPVIQGGVINAGPINMQQGLGEVGLVNNQALVNAQDIAVLLHGIQNNQRPRKINPNDIPTFSDQGHEDADDHLLRFERFADFHALDEPEKVRHFSMSLNRNALRWFECNRLQFVNWAGIKSEFTKTFGKSFVDNDLTGRAAGMFVAEKPLDYVFQTLGYLQSTRPNASEAEKSDILFQGLPVYLKARFSSNRPRTVREFMDRMPDVSREL